MKLKFIEDTDNIMALKDAMLSLKARNQDLPGLGLIYGQAGLGKTRAVRWYSAQYNCPYIRAKAIWTPRGMLADLCIELERDPAYYTAKIFSQVKSALEMNPRLIFIDEADYLTSDWRLLETLRDLHDLTGTSFVLVGMGGITLKLGKHHQFWSRISQVVEFRPLTTTETADIASQLTDLSLTGEVAGKLVKATGGYFRDIMVALSHLERIAKANATDAISSQMVDMTERLILKRRVG